jgi:hypothetical protein
MPCSSAATCGVLIFNFFVCPALRVEDGVDRCGGLTLTAGFLVFSCFYFSFCIWVTHVLNLDCTKQNYSLNVIVHGLAET